MAVTLYHQVGKAKPGERSRWAYGGRVLDKRSIETVILP